jgi:HEAT repeat protein
MMPDETLERALARALADLESSDSEARAAAIGVLGDAQYLPAVPYLTEILISDPGLRFMVATALGKIGDATPLPELLITLRDDDMWVRAAVTSALIKIGRPAVAGLIEAMGDGNKAVRRAAAKALGKIGDPQAVGKLLVGLLDIDNDVRRFSAEALGRIGSPNAIAALLDRLGDSDAKTRDAAATALAEIGEAAVPPLLSALGSANPDVGMMAAFALQRMGYHPNEPPGKTEQ